MSRDTNRFKEEVRLKLCEKYNLPMYKINTICDYPERVLRDVIQSGTLETVMIPYFGKFYVKKQLIRMIDNELVRVVKKEKKLKYGKDTGDSTGMDKLS